MYLNVAHTSKKVAFHSIGNYTANLMRKHGPWQIVSSQQIHADPWMTLQVDQVIRPDGKQGTYTTASVKPGVCVVALDHQLNVYLTREFHYVVGKVTLEAVSGGVEANEEPIAAAQRELREELGIIATAWTHLGTVDPFTASVLSPTQLFLAEQLVHVEHAPEGTELIEKVIMPLQQATAAVMHSEITHAASCVAILKASLLRQKRVEQLCSIAQ